MKTIYFIRHGISCANINQYFPELKTVKYRKTFLDPPLANIGIQTSKSMAEFCETLGVEKVYSSSMNRAIQTAFFMFPQADKIHSIPYIKEFGNDLDRTSMPFEQKHKYLQSEIIDKMLDFTNIDNLNSVNFKKGLEILNQDEDTVAVVSHSLLLESELNLHNIKNNSIWKVEIDKLLTIQNIENIHEGVSIPKYVDDCDYESCKCI